MASFGLIDGIVEEPLGGAHHDPEGMAASLGQHLKVQLDALKELTAEQRIQQRIDKYASMGRYEIKTEDTPETK
jgi:acetyl-CoA carboxylase carboxyl transferase subunit alpha